MIETILTSVAPFFTTFNEVFFAMMALAVISIITHKTVVMKNTAKMVVAIERNNTKEFKKSIATLLVYSVVMLAATLALFFIDFNGAMCASVYQSLFACAAISPFKKYSQAKFNEYFAAYSAS